MSKIPVTVITGFLGSGKTTLLNRALRDPYLNNAVVIVNEFGEIGLDHDLIEASNDSIVLLPNGCICCSVKGDLVFTLIDLYQKRLKQQIPEFDRVVIETSGLAEPTPVLEVLLSDPGIKSCFIPAGVLTTVDAVNGVSTLNLHEQSVKQVALANRIVVTKSDLIEQQDELKIRLRILNPSAEILDSSALNVGELFQLVCEETSEKQWVVAPAESLEVHGKEISSHIHDSRINRFSIIKDDPWDFETLKLFLDALATNAGPSLLRVKGIINLKESPDRPAVVHGAQQLMHNLAWLDRWPSEDRRTRIVFITMDLEAHEVT